MAATVDIMEWNGASGSPTKATKTAGTVRFKNADNSTVDANNPLVKPDSGFERSYEKWLRLRIGATGPTGSITNVQFYADGANGYGTGIDVYVRDANPSAYATPVKPSADTGASSAFTYTSGARKSVGAGPYSGTNVDIGDFIVMHMRVDNTASAPQNTTATETFTFSYDET